MSTFSIKRQIGGFASQSCSGRQRNVLKAWCTGRAVVLIIKSTLIWSCLRRRRSCLISLLPKICFRVKVLELNLLLAWEYCCLSSLPVVGDVSRERLHQWWRGMKCGCIRRLTLVSRYRVRSFRYDPDHGRSNESMNPCPEWIHQFIWSTTFRVISDHWSQSGSSQRNAPVECFHMTSRRSYWCPKTMKRRPCWCPNQSCGSRTFFLCKRLLLFQ